MNFTLICAHVHQYLFKQLTASVWNAFIFSIFLKFDLLVISLMYSQIGRVFKSLISLILYYCAIPGIPGILRKSRGKKY